MTGTPRLRKSNAKSKEGWVGEIQTACQQTCATGAITFDNLKLPGNKAEEAAKANATRSYHALHVLNTRPAITYLAKVAREEGHEG